MIDDRFWWNVGQHGISVPTVEEYPALDVRWVWPTPSSCGATEAGDSVGRTLTDRDGRFSISSAEPGSFTLSASALGYRDTRVGVFELGVGGELTIEFRVAADPLPIEELVVSFNRPILQHALDTERFRREICARIRTLHHAL